MGNIEKVGGISMIQFETARLIIRNITIDDVNDFYEYMSLECTAKYEAFEPLTYDECIASVMRRCRMDNVFAVVLKENGKMIGDINYSLDEYDTYELGYDFNPNYCNQGYATEACRAVIDYIFKERNGRRVYAECNDDNFPSIRLLERLRFRREGYFIEDVAFKKDREGNPIYINSYSYAILKREWLKDN